MHIVQVIILLKEGKVCVFKSKFTHTAFAIKAYQRKYQMLKKYQVAWDVPALNVTSHIIEEKIRTKQYCRRLLLI